MMLRYQLERQFNGSRKNIRRIFISDQSDLNFEAELVEFNGEHDHVHLLLTYPPKVALSNLVASLKGGSARMLRQQFGNVHPWLKRRGVLWSPSYFASSCGGAPIDILRKYIEEQQTSH